MSDRLDGCHQSRENKARAQPAPFGFVEDQRSAMALRDTLRDRRANGGEITHDGSRIGLRTSKTISMAES
ncbi:hypothetical protein [Novosphingobium rosa]|uniref:hypothetical protein n=1 Tax=Novosphingobium rosa TaxID=76978 RepID=UPI00147251DE|nr:hypothetical protein [Novosphingobium rosa]